MWHEEVHCTRAITLVIAHYKIISHLCMCCSLKMSCGRGCDISDCHLLFYIVGLRFSCSIHRASNINIRTVLSFSWYICYITWRYFLRPIFFAFSCSHHHYIAKLCREVWIISPADNSSEGRGLNRSHQMVGWWDGLHATKKKRKKLSVWGTTENFVHSVKFGTRIGAKVGTNDPYLQYACIFVRHIEELRALGLVL